MASAQFELNSTATSDSCAQKLGNNVRRDSELIATKVCSQISHKRNVMFESHVVTSVDRTNFDSWFEVFFINLPLLTIIYCNTDHPCISRSIRSVQNFKFQFSLFLCSWAACWAFSKNYVKWKYFNSKQSWTSACYKMYWCVQKLVCFVLGLDIQPWQPKNNNPECKKLLQVVKH